MKVCGVGCWWVLYCVLDGIGYEFYQTHAQTSDGQSPDGRLSKSNFTAQWTVLTRTCDHQIVFQVIFLFGDRDWHGEMVFSED